MQSKKRIKQIGPFSFLFCNLPDTIYNIKTEKAQNNKSFDVVIIKLKQTSTTLFKKTIDMENFWMFSNPTKKLTTAFDIIVDLNYFIYNHFFCIKETVDDLTLTIFFDENPKNNRTISLNRVEDNDDLLKKSKKDYVTEIKNLIDTLQYQKEKIAKLEITESILLKRVSDLEAKNQKLIEMLNSSDDSQIQNRHKRLSTLEPPSVNNLQAFMSQPPNQRPVINQSTMNGLMGHQRINSAASEAPIKTFNRYNTNPNFTKYNPSKLYPVMPGIAPGPNPPSAIITDKEFEMIKAWVGPNIKGVNLIYRGTQTQFMATTFHNRIDEVFPTFCVIKTVNGYRCGGYTTQNWKGTGIYKSDPNAFVFSLDMKKKFPISKNKVNKAILCQNDFIVAFGEGDLVIVDCPHVKESYSYFPMAYEGVGALTGANQKFLIQEIEIYKIC